MAFIGTEFQEVPHLGSGITPLFPGTLYAGNWNCQDVWKTRSAAWIFLTWQLSIKDWLSFRYQFALVTTFSYGISLATRFGHFLRNNHSQTFMPRFLNSGSSTIFLARKYHDPADFSAIALLPSICSILLQLHVRRLTLQKTLLVEKSGLEYAWF